MFLVLHVPDFALQAVLRTGAPDESLARAERADPVGTLFAPPASAYLKTPAALFTGTTKKSTALAVNAAARVASVACGMSAPQAVARCPALLIRTPNAESETEARATLLALAFTVSPAVEATAPGVVTLEVHGLAPPMRVSAGAAAITRLAQFDLHATAGLARTPLLALYAAQSRTGFNRPKESTATSAAPETASAGHRPAPPQSPTLRLVTDEASFLAPLPLAAAEPDAELAAVVQAWGIHTLGELTALSRDDIGRRLGAAGVALWDRARGGEARPLHLVTPPQNFIAAMEFENELETLEPLLFVLRRFVDRLTLELEGAGFVANDLDLTLSLTDETEHQRSFHLPEPTRDAEILFRTLHTHLESLRTDAPICAARLRLTPARPLVRQHGLFETGLRDPHGFAETLARVVALTGSGRVGTPQLEDTHRPDAVQLAAPPAVVPPPAPAAVQPTLGRPLRRFRPPLPARFEMSAGQPTFLWADHIQGVIAGQRGPWFSSGDWWQSDRAWARAEWDIALANGGIYRLFRNADGWFLEGEYD